MINLKIISGGQTGVDRAALDWALQNADRGIQVGGFCPKGRLAEDGPIDRKYPLSELASRDYSVRTRLNAKTADATLIFYVGKLQGGTKNTRDFCDDLGKPYFLLDLALLNSDSVNTEPMPSGQMRPEQAASVDTWQTLKKKFLHWMQQHEVTVLNVAGPRASKCAQCYAQVINALDTLF